MKKLLLLFFTALIATGCTVSYNNNEKPQTSKSPIDVLTLFSSGSNSQNKVWVGTFQLVFSDMKNEILKLKKVEFAGEKPTSDIEGLNSEEFNSSMLNPETYYKSYGATSPEAKDKIKEDILKKFNETSSLIDTLDWSKAPGRYYAYAMLKKEFEFLKEFDKLEPQSFNNSDEKYDFFGIKNSSDEVLDKNIRVLFYNSADDFAVQLLTKNNDVVYLYRTESEESFDKIYKKMLSDKENYKGKRFFNEIDTFKAPNLKFKTMRRYDELCNKIIKGTDGYYFSNAIETIEFELDNKGGKIKSEAIITLDNAMAAIEAPRPRHFDFDKTFVIFLIDKGKSDPYFALRIKDLKNLNK